MQFELNNETLTIIEVGCYQDKTPALTVIDNNEFPFGTLTVYVENCPPLEPDEYCIKTWSENGPMAKAVLAAGLFKDTGKRVTTGFVQAQIWKRN